MSGTLYCPSDLVTEGGVPVCSSNWVVIPYNPPFDPSQLDPLVAAQALGSGFTLVGTFLVLAMGIRVVLNFFQS